MKRVAVVTRCTHGVGLELVKKLINEGYKVYGTAVSERTIKLTQEVLPTVQLVCGDITNTETIRKIAMQLEENNEQINVLVNNSEVIYQGGIEELATSEWNHIMDVNVNSVFKWIKKLLPYIKKDDNSSIINVSSISSIDQFNSLSLSTSKAAINMMTKVLAKELAKYHIRVNSVNPGMLDTKITVHNGALCQSNPNEFNVDVNNSNTLGIGYANDVSNLIFYLISEEARWITGSNYVVDGGQSISC